MSKSDKLTNQGAVASRSRSAQKVLDSERRFIDDLFQVRLLTFEARPRKDRVGSMQVGIELEKREARALPRTHCGNQNTRVKHNSHVISDQCR